MDKNESTLNVALISITLVKKQGLQNTKSKSQSTRHK